MAIRPPRRTTLEGARAELAQLVAPYASALEAAGVATDALASGDDEALVALYKAAHQPGVLPMPLRELLSELDALATSAGADAIDHVARQRGVVGLPASATPAALAARARLLFPEIFAAARVLVTAEAPASTHEHWPLRPGPVELPAGFDEALRRAASEHFRGRRRSGYVELLIVPRGDEIAIEVTRGDLRRDVTEIAEDDTRRQSRAVRPARRDLVIVHRATGMLSLCTAYPAERALYRRAMGALLHGDEEAYATSPTVRLAPLLGPMATGPSVRAVRVTELSLARPGQPDVRLRGATGLSAYLEGEEGRLVRRGARVTAAVIALDVAGEQRVRVELREPNVVRLGATDRGTEAVVRLYLASRGVLVRPAPHALHADQRLGELA